VKKSSHCPAAGEELWQSPGKLLIENPLRLPFQGELASIVQVHTPEK
jgi:hypothetical protein